MKNEIRYYGDLVYLDSHIFNTETKQLIRLPEHIKISQNYLKSVEFADLKNSQLIQIPKKANYNQILALELTDICNYSCKYCFEGKSINNKGVLDFNVACKAIDKMPPGSEIRFFGGEPLLQFELITKIVEKYPDYFYSIVTNGSLITKKISSFFAKNNFSVGLSFDGSYWQEKNRPNLKGNSIDDFKRAVNFLSTDGVYFGISSVITKSSIPHLYDIHLEVFDDYPIKSWAYLLGYTADMTLADLEIFKINLFKIIDDFPSEHLTKINDLKKWSMKITGEWPIDGFCGAGICYKAVTCAGEERFCTFFLRESSCYGPHIGLTEVNCKKCQIWNYCRGGCRALNLYGSNETNKSHPFSCKKNHIYFEAGLKTAIKIKNELN
jgi:sulfatase maturation enzyme AslB (radical SAM superfamily)